MKIETQQDVRDCGIVVLQSFYKHFFHDEIDLNTIKLKVDYGRNGISIENLINVAEEFNIKIEGFATEFENILDLKGYYIVLINDGNENHYVICKNKRKHIKVWDPLEGELIYKIDDFKKLYIGYVLFISKAAKKPKKIKIITPLTYLKGHSSTFTWVSVNVVFELISTLVSMSFMKIVMDYIIPGQMNNLLFLMVFAFVWLNILRVITGFLSRYLIQKLTMNIEYDLTSTYYSKLISGEIRSLQKLEDKDFIRREGVIGQISSFLAEYTFAIFGDLLKFLSAMTILLFLSPQLFGITLTAGVLIGIFSLVNSRYIKEKYSKTLEYGLKYMSNVFDTINSLESVKNPIVGNNFKLRFKESYRKLNKNGLETFNILNIIQALNNLIIWVSPLLLSFFAVKLIFINSMSIGAYVLFLTAFNMFIEPIKGFVDTLFKYNEYKKNAELINFILNIPDEKVNMNGVDTGPIKTIVFKDALIKYDKPLLEVNLEIKSDVQFVGKNGIGKTTFLKDLALININENILINKLEIDQHNIGILRQKIFFTSINDQLPSGQIFEIITSNNITQKKIFLENMRNYNLGQLLSDLGLSLDTLVINGGENLSSGQKQLIKILRLFSYQYEVIILDEALENIDAKKVEWLRKALKQFQKGYFLEVSHSKKYISKKKKEVNLEKYLTN